MTERRPSKNFRGKQFEADLAALDAKIMRPRRKDEPGKGPHLAPIRQRIESIYWTAKDILTLERHGARTLHALRTRLACRLLALTAAIAPTTDSDSQAALWPNTPPDLVELLI